MLAWLGLLIAQPTLEARGDMDLHRRLGWVGAVLATLITGLGIFAGLASLVLHRFPPFFTPAHFLALTTVEAIVFGLMVMAAIRRRGDTQSHRRLMIGATIVILEPALGRILPMPLIIDWADIPIGLLQLAAVGIIALHDRRTLGRIHPATKAVAAIVVAERLAIYLLGLAAPVAALAAKLTGG